MSQPSVDNRRPNPADHRNRDQPLPPRNSHANRSQYSYPPHYPHHRHDHRNSDIYHDEHSLRNPKTKRRRTSRSSSPSAPLPYYPRPPSHSDFAPESYPRQFEDDYQRRRPSHISEWDHRSGTELHGRDVRWRGSGSRGSYERRPQSPIADCDRDIRPHSSTRYPPSHDPRSRNSPDVKPITDGLNGRRPTANNYTGGCPYANAPAPSIEVEEVPIQPAPTSTPVVNGFVRPKAKHVNSSTNQPDSSTIPSISEDVLTFINSAPVTHIPSLNIPSVRSKPNSILLRSAVSKAIDDQSSLSHPKRTFSANCDRTSPHPLHVEMTSTSGTELLSAPSPIADGAAGPSRPALSSAIVSPLLAVKTKLHNKDTQRNNIPNPYEVIQPVRSTGTGRSRSDANLTRTPSLLRSSKVVSKLKGSAGTGNGNPFASKKGTRRRPGTPERTSFGSDRTGLNQALCNHLVTAEASKIPEKGIEKPVKTPVRRRGIPLRSSPVDAMKNQGQNERGTAFPPRRDTGAAVHVTEVTDRTIPQGKAPLRSIELDSSPGGSQSGHENSAPPVAISDEGAAQPQRGRPQSDREERKIFDLEESVESVQLGEPEVVETPLDHAENKDANKRDLPNQRALDERDRRQSSSKQSSSRMDDEVIETDSRQAKRNRVQKTEEVEYSPMMTRSRRRSRSVGINKTWERISCDVHVVANMMLDQLQAQPLLLQFSFLGICNSDIRHITDICTNAVDISGSEGRILHLNNNRLTSITDTMWRRFADLTVASLNLTSNSLTDLGSKIGACAGLKFLNISRNKLTTVPQELCDLTKLEVLNLSHNGIEKLPSGLRRLNQLKVLSLAKNNLKVLPEDIAGKGAMLTDLDLSDNESLDFFPRCVEHWTLLEVLHIPNTAIYRSLTRREHRLPSAELVRELAGRRDKSS